MKRRERETETALERIETASTNKPFVNIHKTFPGIPRHGLVDRECSFLPVIKAINMRACEQNRRRGNDVSTAMPSFFRTADFAIKYSYQRLCNLSVTVDH